MPAVTGGATWTAGDSLLRARAGDRLAFASLIRAHQRLVYSLALRMLCDSHEAEDLAQEVFMQLHRRLAVIESDAHLLFWLRKVTTNLAIDRLRREQKYPLQSLDDESDIADESLESDPLLQRRLRVLIARLPAAPRAVVLLRFQEDMDPTEIAEALEMSINTVKSHLRRSMAALREGLSGVPDAARSSDEVM
jgi:RNA polymerase sigma-70 factor (ECF subfamily)